MTRSHPTPLYTQLSAATADVERYRVEAAELRASVRALQSTLSRSRSPQHFVDGPGSEARHTEAPAPDAGAGSSSSGSGRDGGDRGGSDRDGNAPKGSLFSSLERQLREELEGPDARTGGAKIGTAPDTASSEGDSGDSGRSQDDVLTEFFMLTAMSVKLSSCFGQDVAGISNDELYARVKEEGVPFHRWHAWVQETLSREEGGEEGSKEGAAPRTAESSGDA